MAIDLGMFSENRHEQVVPKPQSTTFLNSPMHACDMVLDLDGNLGIVGLGQRFDSVANPLHRSANLLMVFEQKMKYVLVIACLRIRAASKASSASEGLNHGIRGGVLSLLAESLGMYCRVVLLLGDTDWGDSQSVS